MNHQFDGVLVFKDARVPLRKVFGILPHGVVHRGHVHQPQRKLVRDVVEEDDLARDHFLLLPQDRLHPSVSASRTAADKEAYLVEYGDNGKVHAYDGASHDARKRWPDDKCQGQKKGGRKIQKHIPDLEAPNSQPYHFAGVHKVDSPLEMCKLLSQSNKRPDPI